MRLREGNVFSCVCCSQGVPHITITNDALDLTVQRAPGSTPRDGTSLTLAPPGHQTWDPPAPAPLLVTSSGHHWRPDQTCSLEDPPPVLISGGH